MTPVAMDASPTNHSPEIERARDLVERGRKLELGGDGEHLAAALRCHDEAIALLTSLEGESGCDVRRELATAWMNRGNALQRCESREQRLAAVEAYDRAIALLAALREDDRDNDSAVSNQLGACWLNRSCALSQFGNDQARGASLESADRAIALLQTLPLERDVNHRINLAGAWLNRACVLMEDSTASRGDRARVSLDAAIEIVAPVADENVVAAEIALRARRAWLAATAEKNPAEASDVVEAGVALATIWLTRGASRLRPLALDFFRVGALIYAEQQPQFLPEFVEEVLALDVPLADAQELQAIIRDASARAMLVLEARLQ